MSFSWNISFFEEVLVGLHIYDGTDGPDSDNVICTCIDIGLFIMTISFCIFYE